MAVTNNFSFLVNRINDSLFEFTVNVEGKNISSFTYNGEERVTRWSNITVIDFFVDHLKDIILEDPYPFGSEDTIGSCFPNEKDILVDFDKLDDDAELAKAEEYMSKVEDWRRKHNWNFYVVGAFYPNVTFRRHAEKIEVSWNNNNLYDEFGVDYLNKEGCALIDLDIFEKAVRELIIEYKTLNHDA